LGSPAACDTGGTLTTLFVPHLAEGSLGNARRHLWAYAPTSVQPTARVFGDPGDTMGKLGDVDFADGVCASLRWLSQSLTYAGLLDGAPTVEMNRALVASARERYRHSGLARTRTTRWSSSLDKSNFP